MSAIFGIDINVTYAMAAIVSAIFIWRFFHYMERKPVKIKRVDMSKETAAREYKEAKENKGDHGKLFRIGNFPKGRIIGSRTYWRLLPTKFGNPTHEPEGEAEIALRNITTQKGFLFWKKKHTYVVQEEEINKVIDTEDIVVPSSTVFTNYHGLWISERINPVAAREHVLGTVDRILMERTTSEYATMMENVYGYLPHHGHESHMIEKETEAIEKRKQDLRENL